MLFPFASFYLVHKIQHSVLKATVRPLPTTGLELTWALPSSEHVARRENALTTQVKSNKSAAGPTCSNYFFFSHSQRVNLAPSVSKSSLKGKESQLLGRRGG